MYNSIKSLLVSALILVAGQMSFAQEDAKAKKILDELSKKTQAYSTITAGFTSKLENKEAGMEVDQEGLIKIKGTAFNLKLDDYLIISDGKSTWTIAAADNEVYVDDASALTGGDISPTEIFTLWEKGFKYNYKGEETINGVLCHQINLYPLKPQEKNFHTIKLYIAKADTEIKKVVVMGKSGDIYTYLMKSFKPNQTLDASLFVFDKGKYPGINVIDNRL